MFNHHADLALRKNWGALSIGEMHRRVAAWHGRLYNRFCFFEEP
jgi:hypothetical protein